MVVLSTELKFTISIVSDWTKKRRRMWMESDYVPYTVAYIIVTADEIEK